MAASDVALAIQLVGSLLIREGGSLYGVEGQIEGLQEELQLMQQYLQDADARQTSERQVCTLVCQVRKLAYDAEDVIDNYIVKLQLRNGHWLRRFAYYMYKYPQIYTVRQQIQSLQTSLKRVSDRLNSYGVRKISDSEADSSRGCVSSESRSRRQRPRSYQYDEDVGNFVVGMEEDIRKLVGVLTSTGSSQVGVVSIVGMGGSGKTTLAMKLYNHPCAKQCFEYKAWVCVSQEWSTQLVLAEILRKLGGLGQTTTLLSVEELVDRIRLILKNKSYLVVLDDVWSREALEQILPALPRGGCGSMGSKIIITTRNSEIVQFRVSHQDQMYIHEPQPLSEESSMELFSKIALNHRQHYAEENFKNLATDMLRKCDGLPLAVIALAGILSTKNTIAEWLKVGKAVRSRILEGRCGNMYGRVGELLELSYDDLSYVLKPCFLYLSLFPEDYEISVGTLTRMWIAEGLVSTQYADVSLEDAALQCIEDLSHRFLVQVMSTNFMGAIKSIRLHDLLRDLSIQKAKQQNFFQIYTPFSNSDRGHESALTIQPRRAAVHSSTTLPAHNSHLRSLILLTRSSIRDTLDLKVVSQNFKLLRMLSIRGVKVATGILPAQIGCLIHLRYLAIRGTNITELPISIRCLKNLLTLDYRDIDTETMEEKNNEGIKIPDNVFQGLVQLRHLFLPVEFPWSVQQLKLSSLTDLQTLWGVRMDNFGHSLLKEMPKLSATVKKLKIVLSGENELKAAFRCPSLTNDVLHTMHCDMRGGLTLCNVEPLRLRKHLLKLTLIGGIETELGSILPINVIELRLKDSMITNDDPMEVLGALAHLKRLSLSNAYTGTTLSCRAGSFPQLEELGIESLPYVDTWNIHKGAMPCLKKLDITKCWRLKNYPGGLFSVTTLAQMDFSDMPNAFRKQATACGWASQKLKLPHNFASIVKDAESPVDFSSIQKLYEQLLHGIFLNNKTKKYWVTKKHGSYVNSYMVYASGLRFGSKQFSEIVTQQKCEGMDHYIKCREVIESLEDRTKVMAAKLKSSKSSGSSQVFGNCDIENLSFEVSYEIYWVVMLEDPEGPDYSLESSLLDSPVSSPEKKEDERPKRRFFPVGLLRS